MLASVIRSPAGYDPDTHADRLQGRFNYVLDGMVSQHWLSAADRAGLQVPKTVKKGKPKGGTNYFLMDTVRKELKAKGFTDAEIDLGGFRVITTFDKKSQAAAVRAVRQERPTVNAKGVHIGLSAVQAGTGRVIAMYGGETAGNLNEATQARIQPGSAFKAFALSAALEDGIGLKSRFQGNSPFKVPGTNAEVNNEFNQSYGANVDLIKATEDSINTAYVDLSVQLGPQKIVDAAIAAGIPEDTPGLKPTPSYLSGFDERRQQSQIAELQCSRSDWSNEAHQDRYLAQKGRMGQTLAAQADPGASAHRRRGRWRRSFSHHW